MRRLAMPEPVTTQGPATFELWKWAWVAAMVVGVITWGLIFFAAWRYRRRDANEVPVQTRYNLPLEVFYTITPILMVVVFFYWTVDVQNKMTKEVDDPDVVMEVVGQQWSWTFNYGLGDVDQTNRDPDLKKGEFAYDEYAFSSGTASVIPTLVLPVDQTIQFNLHSPDVIHSFGIPEFLMKLDVIPGQVNSFQATPTVEGTFPGKCYELCGTSHARMLFNVEVVSQADYQKYIATLETSSTGRPLLGGAASTTVPGLETETQEGAHE
ncbi:MAG: cytochrome c oxidase subunit II [Nocardioides sp.]